MKRDKKPACLITANIQSLSHDGRGVASIDGKTTFISGAIADEKVICKLTKRHSRYNEAETTEVLIAAPIRTEPQCAHFTVCGGCSMQHIEVNAQVQLKQKTLLEHLKHFGKVTPENILKPISGNALGYRRKARLGVRYVKKKERVLVGFREKFSNFLADIESCPVLHDHVGTRITTLGNLIASLHQFDQIPQIEIAVGDTETALVFRNLVPLPDEDTQKLIEFGKAHYFNIYLQPGSPNSIHKIWPQDNLNHLSYSLSEYNIQMQFHPLDFIQVNREINHLMIQQALTLLEVSSSDVVLDLFCGLGNFTLPLARHAQHVTGIEGGEEMVQRAQKNAQHNQITNVDFYAANLMEPTPHSNWMNKKYNKILLDPPRAGAKEIIEFLPRFAAQRIVYVSCNPATLARDAEILVHTHGYKLKHAGVINMFPHTGHIEAIALFEK